MQFHPEEVYYASARPLDIPNRDRFVTSNNEYFSSPQSRSPSEEKTYLKELSRPAGLPNS